MITVDVTSEDIQSGFANRHRLRCFFCPVAVALQRATGDDEARVVEVDWRLYLTAWGRWHPAPEAIAAFVRDFDTLLEADDPEMLEPLAKLAFTLPAFDDGAWKDECCRCQDLFEQTELDEEGRCCDCAASA